MKYNVIGGLFKFAAPSDLDNIMKFSNLSVFHDARLISMARISNVAGNIYVNVVIS